MSTTFWIAWFASGFFILLLCFYIVRGRKLIVKDLIVSAYASLFGVFAFVVLLIAILESNIDWLNKRIL